MYSIKTFSKLNKGDIGEQEDATIFPEGEALLLTVPIFLAEHKVDLVPN